MAAGRKGGRPRSPEVEGILAQAGRIWSRVNLLWPVFAAKDDNGAVLAAHIDENVDEEYCQRVWGGGQFHVEYFDKQGETPTLPFTERSFTIIGRPTFSPEVMHGLLADVDADNVDWDALGGGPPKLRATAPPPVPPSFAPPPAPPAPPPPPATDPKLTSAIEQLAGGFNELRADLRELSREVRRPAPAEYAHPPARREMPRGWEGELEGAGSGGGLALGDFASLVKTVSDVVQKGVAGDTPYDQVTKLFKTAFDMGRTGRIDTAEAGDEGEVGGAVGQIFQQLIGALMRAPASPPGGGGPGAFAGMGPTVPAGAGAGFPSPPPVGPAVAPGYTPPAAPPPRRPAVAVPVEDEDLTIAEEMAQPGASGFPYQAYYSIVVPMHELAKEELDATKIQMVQSAASSGMLGPAAENMMAASAADDVAAIEAIFQDMQKVSDLLFDEDIPLGLLEVLVPCSSSLEPREPDPPSSPSSIPSPESTGPSASSPADSSESEGPGTPPKSE